METQVKILLRMTTGERVELLVQDWSIQDMPSCTLLRLNTLNSVEYINFANIYSFLCSKGDPNDRPGSRN